MKLKINVKLELITDKLRKRKNRKVRGKRGKLWKK